MNNFIVFFIVIGLYFFNGCAAGNTKGENLIINNFSDKEKSVLLSDKGILLYNIMIEKDDITFVPNIKNILQESLKLDPKNQDAGIYLQKTANYVSNAIAKNIKIVKNNLAKKKRRTDDDNYNLCITLQKVYQIDPTNNEVITLRVKTKDIREELAGKMLSYGDAELKLIEKLANKIIQGNAVVPIIEKFNKALLLGSSQENNLTAKRSDFANILSGDMDFIISETKNLIEKNKNHDAEIRFKILNKYNLCVNRKYDAVLKDLQFNFYFDWSKKLYDSNRFDLAYEKIDLALTFKKTNEAQVLQAKIQNRKNKVDVAGSFSSWISEIDDLIDQKEIALAYQKINFIKTLTKVKDNIKELDNRKAKVIALLDIVYNDGVTDFVSGNYSYAVKEFQNTLTVSPNYKDAGNYLKKAKSELKILELY